MKRAWLLTLSFAGVSALADPDDFARGRMIHAVDGQLVQRTTVPEDVYEWATRADLGDLRVFNAEHQEVPYRLHRPGAQQEHTAWHDLPLFPLPGNDIGTRNGASVNVEVDERGAVVAVTGAEAERWQPAAFLVDASGFDLPVTELSVDWQAGDEGFVGTFRVDASDDLNRWRPVVASTTLATLTTQDRTVRVDRLELPGAAASYFKITQLDGNERIAISSVRARARLAQLPERRWKSLPGRAVDAGYEFVLDGAFPLDRIKVDVDQKDYLLVADLYSKAQAGHPWRSRGQHRFYRVAVDDVTAESEPLAYATVDRFWRIELVDGDGQTPRLRVGWLPDEVVFLMQGPGPYLLAYGQAGVSGRQWPLTDLLSRLGAQADLAVLTPATLDAATMLGGPERLTPPPKPPDWRTLLLWLVLVAGVAVVAFFAHRLLTSSPP